MLFSVLILECQCTVTSLNVICYRRAVSLYMQACSFSFTQPRDALIYDSMTVSEQHLTKHFIQKDVTLF